GIDIVALGHASHTQGSLLRRNILPESPVRSMFPSGILPAPTSAITETGPRLGPGFFDAGDSRSLESGNVVGEIGDLLVVDRREHGSHHAVIAVPDVVPIFTHRLGEKVLALVCDVRNAFAAGQIEIVTTIAAMLADELAARHH